MNHEPECAWNRRQHDGLVCICEAIDRAYRRGYSDRAQSEASYIAANQHGKGENP